ncbi:MAG: heme utilization cystosolic carrier protein HutX [Hyphomicrobiales bacterium]
MPIAAQTRDAIKASLEDKPGAVIEFLAREHDATPADVIACLPEGQAVTVGGENFEKVMNEIATWGDVTFLVHTDDLVLEAKGAVPAGSFGRGYYNISGRPIGGHLKADNCASISFVSRPLFDNETHSVQFFNKDGGCMFKIYLGRDENRKMHPDQIEKYRSCREAMKAL